ncbi:hypothetical protein SELSPUOL_01327 [Selenomonas sputigena ATCC 35185]|uniref:Uncharacterized protein n=1 Tax=Selenomonas sputigena (strain ATCC 35185 / DSM 20758 / CCUG 44933 / VPI D19B-28) TaxID=546271 RepID=C9LV37_SELS3|nr:hypothetical protein SELSPUOL_01327 [Selenomonas sputigena ATCC 35185]
MREAKRRGNGRNDVQSGGKNVSLYIMKEMDKNSCGNIFSACG